MRQLIENRSSVLFSLSNILIPRKRIPNLSLLIALCTSVAWRCQQSSWIEARQISALFEQCSKSFSRLLQRCLASQFAVPYFVLFKSSYNHRFSDILFDCFPQEGCSFFLAIRRFTTWLCFRKSTAFSWVTRLRLIPLTCKRTNKLQPLLKELKHCILSYFDHQQNYHYTEENLKIILYRDRKTPKR